MRAVRWVTGLALAAVVASVPLGAFAVANWRLASDATYMAAARLCPSPTDYAALRGAGLRAPAKGAGATLSSVIGAGGELSGRLVSLAMARGAARTVAVANEAFVSRPVGNVVVYGQQPDGGRSMIRAVDLASGCEWSLPTGEDVVRSAVIDAEMSALYVHAVTPGARADAGVRRFELAGGADTQVLPPLTAEAPFGDTYATLLRWSVAGTELAVTSCGWLLCRTRILDTVTGRVQAFDERPHGELVALTATTLYAFDACDQWPCALLAIERATGQLHELEAEVVSASLSMSDGEAVIVIETAAGTREVKP